MNELAERAIYRRAVEAVIWGMPAVNYELMYSAMAGTVGGGFNQIVYWSRLLDWENRTLTPNPGVIYLMPFINTKDVGPMVPTNLGGRFEVLARCYGPQKELFDKTWRLGDIEKLG
jgi:hypothetical protein